jgi:hypothetical protein
LLTYGAWLPDAITGICNCSSAFTKLTGSMVLLTASEMLVQWDGKKVVAGLCNADQGCG